LRAGRIARASRVLYDARMNQVACVLLCTALAGCKQKDASSTRGSATGSAAAEHREIDAASGSAASAVPRPASVTDAHVALIEKSVVQHDQLRALLAATPVDCKKVAESSLEGLALMDQIGTHDDDPYLQWYEATYGAKFADVVSVGVKLAEACSADPGYREVMMKGLGESGRAK
jgi:hypothetical protein